MFTKIVKKFLKKNKLSKRVYQKSKAKWQSREAYSNAKYPPIFVYQMSKVGSQTVYRSLEASGIKNKIYHLHFLSEDIKDHKRQHVEAGYDPPPYHFDLSEALLENESFKDKESCHVISLVRDPVARAVSSFFQVPKLYKINLENLTNEIYIEKALGRLTKDIKEGIVDGYYDMWFDRELGRVFNFDVFTHDFDKEKGYSIYKVNDINIMVIQLEKLTESGPEALSKFVGVEKAIKIIDRNVRSQKKETEKYRLFLKKVNFDHNMCSYIYTSKVVQHFYSEDMINVFKKRWLTQ